MTRARPLNNILHVPYGTHGGTMSELTKPAKMAEPRQGYGIAKIPLDQRTAFGAPVAADTLLAVITKKMQQPLASHGLLATILGLSHATVGAALSTPYAKAHLAAHMYDNTMLANRLHEAQGDSVEYWKQSVEVGQKELTKGPHATSHLLTNARESANAIAKATGLHRDTLRIEATVSTAEDYADLTDLALDADVVSIVDALEAEPAPTVGQPGPEGGGGTDPGGGHGGAGEAHPVPAEESDLTDPESGSAPDPSSDAISAP